MPALQRLKYQSDKGNIFYVISEETVGSPTIRGVQPTDPATEEMTLKVTRNSRAVGFKPRHALLARTIGSADPTARLTPTAERYKRLPILTPAHAGTLVLGENVTIAGTIYKIKKIIPEDVN